MQHQPAGIAAVRGATSVPANTPEAIRDATARLLRELIAANGLEPGRIVSAVFTSTPDLNAEFPARVARQLGWHDVPLLGAQEVAVPGAPSRIVRVLVTLRVPEGATLKPVYLDEAAELRPDLAGSAAESSDEPWPPRDAAGATRTVAIIGLGQIGGSIGLALGQRAGWRRIGWDVDPGAVEAGRRRCAIDSGAASLEDACSGADLAVLAAPVDALPGLVAEAARALRRGAALLDTGSTRAPTTSSLARAVERGIRAVGGHPFAGTEGAGMAAARSDLFRDTAFALMPIEPDVPQIVSSLVTDLGARPIRVDPVDHDFAAARTSHLPYLVARALGQIGGPAARAGLSGPAFRDMTRVARSDPRTAMAYCRANIREIDEAWSELRAAIDREVGALSTPK